MDAIKGVLKEELQNSLQMKRDYKREMEKLSNKLCVEILSRFEKMAGLSLSKPGKRLCAVLETGVSAQGQVVVTEKE
ncbi:MAG TPA: hypothetical protein DDW17_00915 [Deltaproteobacteria bacterium]|nr:hypothetical protein [Deltaproteobacteria bacterium]